jgi:outer membrane receptor protein involved in Fe transport
MITNRCGEFLRNAWGFSQRGSVACVLSVLLGAGATCALAQTAPESATAAAGGLEEVTVTGTRIISNGYNQPTPVTVATKDDLTKIAPTNLADALNETMPQFVNSSSPSRASHNFTSSPTAENGDYLNLRGVGGERTLILFDGVRMPPTTYFGLVDVDVIPEMLVQRVDVVTGGASAVYGSDAVAGVVNFVLDHNFTGVKFDAQYGESEQRDNENYRVGIAAGFNLFDNRAHLLVSGEIYNNNGMLRSDRASALADYVFVGQTPGSASPPGSAANPFVITPNISIAASSATGLMLSGPLAGQQFTTGGTGVKPFNAGTPTGTPGYFANGDGLVIPPEVTANAPLNMKKAYGRFNFDFSPEVSAHLAGTYSRNRLDYILEANGFIVPTAASLFSGNPYLPAVLQDAMTASNTPSVLVDKYPFGPSPNTEEVTEFYMIDLGLEGKFGSHWKWNADYVHGHSNYDVQQHDTLDWRKTFASIDVVRNAAGNPVCYASQSADPAIAAQYADCQPLNVLNESATPAGLNYALGTSAYTAVITQDSVQASLSGDAWQLPAGPVGVAVGAEYRKEKLDLTSNSDPGLLDTPAEQAAYFAGLRGVPPGLGQFFWLTNTGTANGSVNVKEGFLELNVPLLKEKPFADSLAVSAAGRITDYSTSGTVNTWKLGATWAPIPDIQFRGTLSADIRAPTPYNLFAGPQFGIGQLYDPVTNMTANLQTITTGNPHLDPEKSRTTTVGMVVRPQALPGLSGSIDWYRLDISGAIGSITAQQIVNDCANSNGTSPECAFITRPCPTCFPTAVTLSPLNSQVLLTEGWDFDVTYRGQVGPGALGARLFANYISRFVDPTLGPNTYGGPPPNVAGYAVSQTSVFPHIRATMTLDYKVSNWDVFLAEQFIGPMNLNPPITNMVHVNPDIPSVFYTNLTVEYAFGIQKVNSYVYFTVNNLFDKQPPLIPGTIPGLNVPTAISLYDTVGRAYTLGVRFRF